MEKVYLGMPDSWATDKCEESDHYTTKVGGLPDWPIPISAIKSNLLICSKCGSNLCLVTQIYAPLLTGTLKIEERILYVLGCVASQCGSSQESWRVLRLQKASPRNVDSELAYDDKSSLTLDTEDDDSETDNPDMSLEELANALAASLTLPNEHDNNSNKRQPKNVPKHSTLKKTMRVADKITPVLPCFYIYSEEEKEKTRSKTIESLCPNLASVSTKKDNGQEQEETWEEEAYEYDRALTADRTFLKFKKRLDAYPEQCFRYSYGGSPLVASRKGEDSGSCKHCGGSRNYEMQLMSPLLFHLQDQEEESKEHSLDNWNWLTLIVHTCSNSCFANDEEDIHQSDGWSVIEEAITVHNDDDQKALLFS